MSAETTGSIEDALALVEQAEAVATLVHCDGGFNEETAKHASGAVATCLQQAIPILQELVKAAYPTG